MRDLGHLHGYFATAFDRRSCADPMLSLPYHLLRELRHGFEQTRAQLAHGEPRLPFRIA